jgi:purine-binding chemotaxis protein CheW
VVVDKFPTLLVRAGSRICALPITAVNETLRPLPVEAVRGMPPAIRGLAVIRGAAVPVVDLAALLGGAAGGRPTRFVSVRAGDRTVALAVDAVLGVRELDRGQLQQVAPLLGDAVAEVVQAIGTLDRDLLMVLDAGRAISDGVWQALEPTGEGT